MVEYNKVNVKLSDSQINKLKSAAKNQIRITLKKNLKMLIETNYLMNYY